MRKQVIILHKEPQQSVTAETEGPFKIERPPKWAYVRDTERAKWSERESLRYTAFISHYELSLENKPIRVLWPLFDLMSRFIGTRNACQCKNYHKKLVQEFKCIKVIVSFLTDLPDSTLKLKQEAYYLQEFLANLQKLAPQPAPQEPLKPSEQFATSDKYDPEPMMDPSTFHSLSQAYSAGDPRSQLVLECHYFFTKWVTKLERLVGYSVKTQGQ